MEKQAPIFLADNRIKEILAEVVSSIPEKTDVYLYGGAVRNSFYYLFFKDKFSQRDFDIIVIGEKQPFINALLSKGFVFGKRNEETRAVIKKAKNESTGGDDYSDWVVLDITFKKDVSIEEILSKKSNFTINSMGLNIKDIFSDDWQSKVFATKIALEDLKHKQIRVMNRYPINIFACIRFAAFGFTAPTQKEIDDMLQDLKQIEDWRFERDKAKVIEYVGSADKVLEIAKHIGIGLNILDLNEVKTT
jgi:hypothetical protein